MEQLTPEGLRVVNELAQRYGFSQEAVIQMMFAMLRGRGAMAQFNHPEFAGSGQWMRGGMLMLGDMFNHALKARVDGLCQAIAAQLASQPELFPLGSVQSQSQSGGGQQMQLGGAGAMPMAMAPLAQGGHSLFTPDPRDTWWPEELGTPSAIGSQNDLRYAFFPSPGRLAVEANGRVTVYDTGEHHIAGLSQQQVPGGAVAFSTPGGSISLASLSSVAGGVHQQAQSSIGGGIHQQAQRSAGGSQQQQQLNTGLAPMSGLPPMGGMAPIEAWWPPELGTPSSTGAQKEWRYALFPTTARLAVDSHGRVSVRDIGDLQISGCCQGGDEGELYFTTSTGIVTLSSLPEAPAAATPTPVPAAETANAERDRQQAAVLGALSKLGELKAMGILSEEEFTAKKAELLRRL
ncbi:MAG: SHOCT domain-containing protein [Cyanobacteriota bacterium]